MLLGLSIGPSPVAKVRHGISLKRSGFRGSGFLGLKKFGPWFYSLGFVQKYHIFDFLFFISTFEIIDKHIIFLVNNLFIMVYKLITIT